jgi:hypothetical protein
VPFAPAVPFAPVVPGAPPSPLPPAAPFSPLPPVAAGPRAFQAVFFQPRGHLALALRTTRSVPLPFPFALKQAWIIPSLPASEAALAG